MSEEFGWKDPNHDWEVKALLKVPTWAPYYMQFAVRLSQCRTCSAYKTEMGAGEEEEYVTPSCGVLD